jgi:iron complex outermembrane receptor protein
MPALADFTAGASNQCRRIYSALIPSTDRFSALASGKWRFDSGIEVFSELMYSKQTQDTPLVPRSLISTRLPATNAYNPFGTDVLVSYIFDSPQAQIAYHNDAHFSRALLGARGELPRRWSWELAAWDARDKAIIDQGASLVNSANLTAALASSNPATALNLFTSGPAGSDALLASIYGVNVLDASSGSQVASGFVRGPLFDLPAGALEVVLGGEFSHNEIRLFNTSGTYHMTPSRDVSSLFSEVRVPLLHSLTAGGAIRYDHYDTFGGHVTPQYSLEWRPAPTLSVRAAYAEAFKAPILYALNYPQSSFPDSCCVTDPTHGGQSVPYTYIRVGNPNLDPESAESKSVALTWAPRAGVESSLNWWQINQHDRVTTLPEQTVVDNESLFPGRVVRDAQTGVIQSVNVGDLNFGELRVSGSDLAVRYRADTARGKLSPSLSVTRIYKYEAIVTPGAAVTSRLDVADGDAWAPKWKGTVGLAWELGPYAANVAGRYVSRYRDYPGATASTRPLGDFWLWDMSLKYRLDALLAASDSRLRDAFVQVSAVNLFNSLPVYSSNNGGTKGYDSAQYDIRGRFLAVNVGVQF